MYITTLMICSFQSCLLYSHCSVDFEEEEVSDAAVVCGGGSARWEKRSILWPPGRRHFIKKGNS